MIDLLRRQVSNPREPFSGSICVWGPMGSPGKSTLALNLACELSMIGRTVLLIDLDTVGPSIGAMVGSENYSAGLAAAARLAGQDRLDGEQIKRLAFVRNVGRGSLWVLPGLGNASRWPEVSPEKAAKLIRVAEENFDVVIVDVASALEASVRQIGGVVDRNSAARTALEKCTRTLAVMSADPVGVKRFLETHEEMSSLTQSATLVANRVRASVLGQGARDQISAVVADRCGHAVETFIPDDADSCDKATLQMTPLALLKRISNARQAIAKLAREHFEFEGQHKAARAL
jgi:MinD-like ATPase involved in chromosome partitioning or flagellar assembly